MIPFDQWLKIMTKPWVILLMLLGGAFLYTYVDQPVAYYCRAIDFKSNFHIVTWITRLGLGGFYLVPFLLLALFFRYIRLNKTLEWRMWFLWCCALIPSLICLVLKMLLGRSRPELLFLGQLYGFYGWGTDAQFWSFPSGHTTTIMGFVFGLCVLFPKYSYAFLISGLLVATSRILLTEHYVSDVVVASYLALLEVGVLCWWFRRENKCYTARDHQLND